MKPFALDAEDRERLEEIAKLVDSFSLSLRESDNAAFLRRLASHQPESQRYVVDVYRCECGSEWEEECPAACPACGDEPRLIGREESKLGPCPMCDGSRLVASKRGPLPCLTCQPESQQVEDTSLLDALQVEVEDWRRAANDHRSAYDAPACVALADRVQALIDKHAVPESQQEGRGERRRKPEWKGVPFAEPQPGDKIVIAVSEGNPEAGETHDEVAEVLANDGEAIRYRLSDGTEATQRVHYTGKVRVPAALDLHGEEGR